LSVGKELEGEKSPVKWLLKILDHHFTTQRIIIEKIVFWIFFTRITINL
jgi:hypothetical protein